MLGIIEHDGAVFNKNGLDIAALWKHFGEHKSVLGFKGGDVIVSFCFFSVLMLCVCVCFFCVVFDGRKNPSKKSHH